MHLDVLLEKCYNNKAVGERDKYKPEESKEDLNARQRRLTEPERDGEEVLKKSIKKYLTKLRQCDIM